MRRRNPRLVSQLWNTRNRNTWTRTTQHLLVALACLSGTCLFADAGSPKRTLGENAEPSTHAAQAIALLASSCTGCHGREGGKEQLITPLYGRPAEELTQRLFAYRRGGSGTLMPRIVAGYTQPQLLALAAYFSINAHPVADNSTSK